MKSLLLLIAGLVFAAEVSAVTLTIRAEPEADLPGLLPSLRIWITNEGSTAVQVPEKVALQVISPRGEAFIAYSGLRGENRVMLLAGKPLTLEPGETRDLSFWTQDDWFSGDVRFLATGTFRLQLVADEALDSNKLGGVSRVVDQPGLLNHLVSNETTFTAIEPSGADLAVWNLAKGKGQVCTPELTEQIWEQYPTSRYAAYCVRHFNDRDPMKQIAGYQASLDKGPRPVAADAARLNIARAWISRGYALIDSDVEEALRAYGQARTILESLAKNAVAPEQRRNAADMLRDDVRTREEVVRSNNRDRGIEEKIVRVGVGCFQQLPDGRYKVWFGHNNTTSLPITVPMGNDNKFTPPPFDRSQPTTFPPGMFAIDFHVVTKEPVLTWHLQKETAQFKANETVECPPWFNPKDPNTWTLEEP